VLTTVVLAAASAGCGASLLPADRTDPRINRLNITPEPTARPAPPPDQVSAAAEQIERQPGESLQSYKNRLLDMAKRDLISAGPGGQNIDDLVEQARQKGAGSPTP
jgi:hypothetical protein